MTNEEAQFWTTQTDTLCVAIDRLMLEVYHLHDHFLRLNEELTRIRQNTDVLVKEGQG